MESGRQVRREGDVIISSSWKSSFINRSKLVQSWVRRILVPCLRRGVILEILLFDIASGTPNGGVFGGAVGEQGGAKDKCVSEGVTLIRCPGLRGRRRKMVRCRFRK